MCRGGAWPEPATGGRSEVCLRRWVHGRFFDFLTRFGGEFLCCLAPVVTDPGGESQDSDASDGTIIPGRRPAKMLQVFRAHVDGSLTSCQSPSSIPN